MARPFGLYRKLQEEQLREDIALVNYWTPKGWSVLSPEYKGPGVATDEEVRKAVRALVAPEEASVRDVMAAYDRLDASGYKVVKPPLPTGTYH